MSRISSSLVGPSRPNDRRLKERLAWFVAAYVLVATLVTTVAADLRGVPYDPPTSLPSCLETTVGGRLAALREARPDAGELHSSPL
jgi:hypothetical protein